MASQSISSNPEDRDPSLGQSQQNSVRSVDLVTDVQTILLKRNFTTFVAGALLATRNVVEPQLFQELETTILQEWVSIQGAPELRGDCVKLRLEGVRLVNEAKEIYEAIKHCHQLNQQLKDRIGEFASDLHNYVNHGFEIAKSITQTIHSRIESVIRLQPLE